MVKQLTNTWGQLVVTFLGLQLCLFPLRGPCICFFGDKGTALCRKCKIKALFLHYNRTCVHEMHTFMLKKLSRGNLRIVV